MSSNKEHPDYAAIVEQYSAPKSQDVPIDPSEDPEVQDAAKVDRFGYYHPNGIQEKEPTEEEKKRLSSRLEKWRVMIAKWSELDSVWERMFRDGHAVEKLTRRVYKGIPQQYRMIVWPLLLRVPETRAKHPNLYMKMLNRAKATSDHLDQIDKDVNRTLRDTTFFRTRYGSRQQALFNILAAYSVYNTEVGYCQGMSDLVGLFLIYIIEEEDAFWALAQLMVDPRYRMHGLFVGNFPGLYRLFQHHERVVKRLLPSLSKHLTQTDVFTSTYALKWFMQCFMDRIPVSLVLRLWDIFLLEGERILIGMAYNILKMHKKALLRMDQCQITSFFQDELAKNFQFSDEAVIESLKDCLEQLHRNKLDQLPAPSLEMLPKRSVGSSGPEMVWQSQPILNSQVSLPRERPPFKPNLKSANSADNTFRPRRHRSGASHPTPRSTRPEVISPTKSNASSSSVRNQPGPTGLDSSAAILTMAAMTNRNHATQTPIRTNAPSPAYYRYASSYGQESVNGRPISPPLSIASTTDSTGGPRMILISRPPSGRSRTSSNGRSHISGDHATPVSSPPPFTIQISSDASSTRSITSPTYGYATTDSKQHRAAKAALLPSQNNPRSSSRPNSNNVMLLSVKPLRPSNDNLHDSVSNRLARVVIDQAPHSSTPVARLQTNNTDRTGADFHNRYIIDRMVPISPTPNDQSVSSSSSTSEGLGANSQPWQPRSPPILRRRPLSGEEWCLGPPTQVWSTRSGFPSSTNPATSTTATNPLSEAVGSAEASVHPNRPKDGTLVPHARESSASPTDSNGNWETSDWLLRYLQTQPIQAISLVSEQLPQGEFGNSIPSLLARKDQQSNPPVYNINIPLSTIPEPFSHTMTEYPSPQNPMSTTIHMNPSQPISDRAFVYRDRPPPVLHHRSAPGASAPRGDNGANFSLRPSNRGHAS